MNLAILFWIYRDLPLCIQRVRRLRRLNPTLKIYGLFGGDLSEAEAFDSALSPLVDDFYIFPEERPSEWKWLQGDQLIAHWFTHRGHRLEWDTVFVAQWDLLTLSPLSELCSNLGPGQILLPGLRPLHEVSSWWQWVRPGSSERQDFERFCTLVAETHPLPSQLLCCSLPAAAFPREFLVRYATIPEPGVGFLEYKIPIYAQIWGVEFCTDHAFNLDWKDHARSSPLRRYLKTFHAEKQTIRTLIVILNALNPWGRRVFHPYRKPAPLLLRALEIFHRG